MLLQNLLARSVTVALLASFPVLSVDAQPTSEEAIEAIVGSPVSEHQAGSAADEKRILAAMAKTVQNTRAVRKTSSLENLEIVFLPDAAKAAGGPPPAIEAELAEREEEIKALREEIQSNAMLYHALDSRQVLVSDVVAVEFDGPDKMALYVAARPSE